MKKFFSSGGGNDSFVGKTFIVGRCPCVVEEVIAEGKLKLKLFLFLFFVFHSLLDVKSYVHR